MAFPAAYAITANSLTAETFRQAPSSLIAGTGVVGSGDLAVTANGIPNMSVNVAAGQVWIPGTLASTTGFGTNLGTATWGGLPTGFTEQGCYYAWNNSTANLVISAADPTNPRQDLICASIQDAAYSGSLNQAVLQVITGTPAPNPLGPAAPASTTVLAYVNVAAAATSITSGDIGDIRPILAISRSGPATTWTPTLTASGGGLALGNSTLTGRYVQYGHLIYVEFDLTIGSTFAAGSGYYQLSLPVVAAAAENLSVGTVAANNGGINKAVLAFVTGTSQLFFVHCATDALVTNSGVGAAWATGDTFAGTVVYRTA